MSQQPPRSATDKASETAAAIQAAKDRLIDKNAEEIVLATRLKAIEKDHRSIGSMIDTRQLSAIVDPPKSLRAAARADAEQRMTSRRGAKGTAELTEQTDKAFAAMRKKGISLSALIAQGFENEELIWKTKANDPDYTQKRKYDHPELQHFRDRMTLEQRRLYKEKTRERLLDLAQKYRDEMMAAKAEMDLSAVFHPEANAHRAHCMYLNKLYKSIRADTIEDPVLKELLEAERAAKKEKEDEEKRKVMLLRLADIKAGGAAAVAAQAAIDEEERLAKIKEEELAAAEAAKQTKTRQGISRLWSTPTPKGTPGNETKFDPFKKSGPKMTLSESKSQPQLSRNKLKSTTSSLLPEKSKTTVVNGNSGRNGGSSSSNTGNGNSNGNGSSNNNNNSGDGGGVVDVNHGEKAEGTGSGGGNNPNAHVNMNNVAPATDGSVKSDDNAGSKAMQSQSMASSDQLGTHKVDKIFTKIKRGKLGASDPRNTLVDEAARFDEADIVAPTRNRDRNTLLDEQISAWMLNNLQMNQIVKASEGHDILAPTTSIQLGFNTTKMLPFDQSDDADKESHFNTLELRSPTKLIPFEEFAEMFQKFSNEAQMKQEQKKKEEKNRLNQLQQEHHGKGASKSGGDHKHASTRQKQSHKSKSSLESLDDHSEDNGDKNLDNMSEGDVSIKSKSSLRSNAGGGGGALLYDDLDAFQNSQQQMSSTGAENGMLEIVDVVAELAQKDEHFDKFLKVQLRNQPQGRILINANAKMTKPRKIRSIAPLGKSAVILTNANGKPPTTKKGFINYFRDPVQESSSDDESSQTSKRAHKKLAYDESLFAPGGSGTEEFATRSGGGEGGGEFSPGQFPTHSPDTPNAGGGGADSRDNSPSSRSRSRRRGTGSRSRSRSRSRGKAKAGSIANEEEIIYDMQTKLVQTWDLLQVPALQRLSFMRKYCSPTYAAEMARAVDMWAEAAVYVSTRVEVLKLLKKLSAGFCVLPLKESHILDSVMKTIPVTLNSSNPALLPQVHISGHDQHAPLSVIALESLPKSLTSVFKLVYSRFNVTLDENEAEAGEAMETLHKKNVY